MRRVDEYIARTVWASILLVLLVIVSIDALSAFIDESDSRSERYDFAEIGRYVVLTLPGRVYEYIPFAALIGALIGLGQLASTSELVVMRAAGVSNLRLGWTVLRQAILIAVIGFLIGEYLAPQTEQRAQSARDTALYENRQLAGERGVWRRDGTLFMHVRAVAQEGLVLGVTIYDFAEDGWLHRALSADRARFEAGGWRLEDVAITTFTDASLTRSEESSLFLPSNISPRVLTLENVAPGQLALDDLVDYTAFLRTQGEDTASFELATWRKILQPASVAALVLVAISFVFGPLRDGSLGLRIVAGVMTGVLFRLSQDLLGPASLVYGFPPVYAAATPVALCLALGLLLLRRA